MPLARYPLKTFIAIVKEARISDDECFRVGVTNIPLGDLKIKACTFNKHISDVQINKFDTTNPRTLILTDVLQFSVQNIREMMSRLVFKGYEL